MLKWVSGQWVKYHKSATHVTDSNLPCMVTNNWQKSIVTDNLSDNTCPSILLGSSPTVIQYYPVFRAFPILPDHSLFKIWRVWCHNGNDLGREKKYLCFRVPTDMLWRKLPNLTQKISRNYTVNWPESEENSLTFPDHSPVTKIIPWFSLILKKQDKFPDFPSLSRKINFSLTFPDFPWWWERWCFL